MANARQSQASLDYLAHRGSPPAKELAATTYRQRTPTRAKSTLGSHNIQLSAQTVARTIYHTGPQPQRGKVSQDNRPIVPHILTGDYSALPAIKSALGVKGGAKPQAGLAHHQQAKAEYDHHRRRGEAHVYQATAKAGRSLAATGLGNEVTRWRESGKSSLTQVGSRSALGAAQPGSVEVREAIQRATHAGYRVKKMRADRDGVASGPGSLARTEPVSQEVSLKKLVRDFGHKVDQPDSPFLRQKPWGHGGPSLSFVSRPTADPNQLGWGAYDLRDPIQRDQNRIFKPNVRTFDEKQKQRFVYQQDGFSSQLDRKLGFQYSDRFNIKQMREEIFSIMSRINKTGHYSKYDSRAGSQRAPTEREEEANVPLPEDAKSNGSVDQATPARVMKQPRHVKNMGSAAQAAAVLVQEGNAKSNPPSKRHEVQGISKVAGADGRAPPKEYRQLLEKEHHHQLGTGSTKMDSILSLINPDASTQQLGLLRGESTISHLLPTQNSRQTNTSEAAGQLSSPKRRLSEYKMIVDGCHCPRFRKMKDVGQARQSQFRQEQMRARQLSALATQKYQGALEAPGGLAYLARPQHFGTSLEPDSSVPSRAHQYIKNSGTEWQNYSHNDLAHSLDRHHGVHLSMDVGGMQLPEAGTSARNSPAGRLVNQPQVSQLAQKLRHLGRSSDNTALPSSNAQASTQAARKGQDSKVTLDPDGASGLDSSPGKGSTTGPGLHSSALNDATVAAVDSAQLEASEQPSPARNGSEKMIVVDE